MPGRRSLPLYMRGWAGALLLAAARISGDSAGTVHGGGYSAGVFDRKRLRAALYGVMCAPGIVHRFLARSTDATGATGHDGPGTTGADRVVVRTIAAPSLRGVASLCSCRFGAVTRGRDFSML